MKRAIVMIMERLVAVVMMLCIISGVILMMCESADWETQSKTLFIGFGLFILGILPGMIISAVTTRKEKRVNGKFYE